MDERLTVGQKFRKGYLPYTATVLMVLALLAMLATGPAAVAAFFVILLWGAGFCLCQLAILVLPARQDDRTRFHTDCMVITLGSLLVSPLFIEGFMKLAGLGR